MGYGSMTRALLMDQSCPILADYKETIGLACIPVRQHQQRKEILFFTLAMHDSIHNLQKTDKMACGGIPRTHRPAQLTPVAGFPGKPLLEAAMLSRSKKASWISSIELTEKSRRDPRRHEIPVTSSRRSLS